ncbi:hypothetical protein SAY86_015935 [Trapa natans]|uniref:Stress-related protein n=1 Tax=Trapa natans TaxID=22666 RepID=A0AAN7R0W5_TRANT|nr:hypothetical protein SAY86_015935 [Trapa natans]
MGRKVVGEEERLKYLEFVQVAAVHAILCFLNVYGYAKEKSGQLKPGVETVEGTVKIVVGPVYHKFHDVPVEVLKFVDRKIDGSVIKLDSHVIPTLKQVSDQALSAAQQAPLAAQTVASEVKRAGVEPTAKELYSKYEPKVEQCAASTWRKLNSMPLFPHVAQVMVPAAAYCSEKYNQTVRISAEKGYKVSTYLPEKIAKVFRDDIPEQEQAPLVSGTGGSIGVHVH